MATGYSILKDLAIINDHSLQNVLMQDLTPIRPALGGHYSGTAQDFEPVSLVTAVMCRVDG